MERNRLLKIENHQLKQAHSKFVAPLLLANGANMSEEVNIGIFFRNYF